MKTMFKIDYVGLKKLPAKVGNFNEEMTREGGVGKNPVGTEANGVCR
jgi:hypothetical protein